MVNVFTAPFNKIVHLLYIKRLQKLCLNIHINLYLIILCIFKINSYKNRDSKMNYKNHDHIKKINQMEYYSYRL